MPIGPDGTFPLGGPINACDRGGLYAAFSVSKSMRKGVMRFGTPLSWLAGSPEEMKSLAVMIRRQIVEAFGRMRYDKSTLPIKVTANKEQCLIELALPTEMETLVANPEMWLALAAVIEAKIRELRQ